MLLNGHGLNSFQDIWKFPMIWWVRTIPYNTFRTKKNVRWICFQDTCHFQLRGGEVMGMGVG